jgi:hypothetical protein
MNQERELHTSFYGLARMRHIHVKMFVICFDVIVFVVIQRCCGRARAPETIACYRMQCTGYSFFLQLSAPWILHYILNMHLLPESPSYQ